MSQTDNWVVKELLKAGNPPPLPWIDIPEIDMSPPHMCATVPDLVNVRFPDGDAYQWFELSSAGSEDFELFELHDHTIGKLCPELQDELDQASWEDMIDVHWKVEQSGEGWSFATSWLCWALAHGIAPGQPFLFRFGKPQWSSDYYGECDVEYDAEFVRALPMPMEDSRDCWARVLKELQEDRASDIKAMREHKELRRHDVKAMFLGSNSYFGRSQMSGEMPSGVRYSLYTDHNRVNGLSKYSSSFTLVTGESEVADHKEAMNRLVEKAAKELPHLTEKQIRGLPRRWR